MRLEDLGKNIKEQLPPFNGEDSIRSLEELLDTYVSLLKTVEPGEYDHLFANKEIVVKKAQQINADLIEARKYFFEGNIIGCYEKIYDLLFKDDAIFVWSANAYRLNQSDKCYFRMRENHSEYLYKKEEMFHIPFEKRHLVGNQRFSLSGFPCLYLGSSIYLCWEELNRPNIDTANVVAVKPCNEMKLIDLRMPETIVKETDFYRIPLIVACSMRVKNPNAPFKPEYIIPQAIIHAVVTYNSKVDDSNYDGVIYYSTRIGDRHILFHDNNLLENIVIPSGQRKELSDDNSHMEGFCPNLCERLRITEPTSLSIERMLETQFYLPDGEVSYKRTPLGRLEAKFMNRKLTMLPPPKKKIYVKNPSEQ